MDVSEMQPAENNEQQEQQRRYAGEAQQVEIAHSDLRKGGPSSKTDRRNKKAGDGKKHLNAELTIPNKQMHELGWEKLGIEHLRAEKAYVDMVHQHEKDRKPTEQVYPV
jgi:hypothetical protein